MFAIGAHPMENIPLSRHLLQSFFASKKHAPILAPTLQQCPTLQIWHSVLFTDTRMNTYYSPSLLRKGIRTLHQLTKISNFVELLPPT